MTTPLDVGVAAGSLVREWETWRAQRLAAVTAPFGTASLVSTTWLAGAPVAVDGVPGTWSASASGVVGTGLAGSGYRWADGDRRGEDVADVVELARGEHLTDGTRRLGVHVREGAPALRLYDSSSQQRTDVLDLDAYAYDPALRLVGRFEPGVAQREQWLVDGFRTTATSAGTIHVAIEGREHALVASAAGDGFQIVFGDTTNGVETYRFRFLGVGPAQADGSVVVDLNRAFLPPCAFSDAYVCPLPSSQNRLPVAVRAGERRVVRAGG